MSINVKSNEIQTATRRIRGPAVWVGALLITIAFVALIPPTKISWGITSTLEDSKAARAISYKQYKLAGSIFSADWDLQRMQRVNASNIAEAVNSGTTLTRSD